MGLPIQLISTDFDGTIFAEFENPPVPLELQDLLRQLQAAGAKWVINTGRDLSSLMEALGRAHLAVKPDFLVLVEREIYRHDGVRYAGVEPWNRRCAEDHAALFARVLPDVPALTAWINARFDAMVYADPYSPFCLIAKANGDADAICDYLAGYCRKVPHLVVVRNDVYARFSHDAYSKGTALSEVARLLGVLPEHVFAAGDHWNDLPMLTRERAHWLLSPANAIEPVKQAVLRQGGRVSAQRYGLGVEEGLRAILRGGT